VANLTFARKGDLAIALAPGEENDRWWQVFWAVNQVRNTIAHKIDSNEISDKIKFLRDEFVKVLNEEQAKYVETLSEETLVDIACQNCAGFLGMLEEDAKARGIS